MSDFKPDRFAALVAPHLETLYRMAYRLLRHAPDAQDLVQDTCVIACGRLAEIAAADSPVAWLLRVQHNRFIDGERRRRRSPVISADDAEDTIPPAGESFDPEELMQQYQNEQALEHAFLQLNEMHRTLLSLRAEGYELPEIEIITGIDRKALSAKLYRARVTLAQRLMEQKDVATTSRRAGSQP